MRTRTLCSFSLKHKYFGVVGLSHSLSLCFFVSLQFYVACLYQIKAFIEVQLLSNIAYIHLQLHPTLVRLSQPEPACGLQQTDTVIVLSTLENTEHCLVVCVVTSPFGSPTLQLIELAWHPSYLLSHNQATVQCVPSVSVSAFVCICHEQICCVPCAAVDFSVDGGPSFLPLSLSIHAHSHACTNAHIHTYIYEGC